MTSPIIAAFERAGDVPDIARAFDAAASGGDGVGPDFYEISARVSDRLEPYRATYYFDVGKHGRASAVAATERFASACRATGVELPAALLDSVAHSADCVLQLVLGIDAGTRRSKYYLIFRGDPTALVSDVGEALDLALPAAVDRSAIYILGVDLYERGSTDLKAYVKLRDERIASTLRDPGPHRELLAGSRYVVFQQCVASQRRQMYFHADNPAVIERELHATEAAATPALREHVAAMNAGADSPLEPWILAYPYADGVLDRSRYTAYFHFAE